MLSPTRLLVVGGILLSGCGTARDVAVTSFRIFDAPAAFVRRRIDPVTTTTTVETTQTSDVVTPGRPVTPPPQPTPRHNPTHRAQTNASANANRAPRPSTSATQMKPRSSATPRGISTVPTQFPTAKPVPGRPGYVYSVDPKGGIVDVTGYKSGDKAKDPYTKQVFIVP